MELREREGDGLAVAMVTILRAGESTGAQERNLFCVCVYMAIQGEKKEMKKQMGKERRPKSTCEYEPRVGDSGSYSQNMNSHF